MKWGDGIAQRLHSRFPPSRPRFNSRHSRSYSMLLGFIDSSTAKRKSGQCKKLSSWSNPSSTSIWQTSSTKKISNETKLLLAFIAFFAFYTILTFYFKSSFFRNLVEIEIFDGISGENLKFHYFLIKFLRISLDLNLMPFLWKGYLVTSNVTMWNVSLKQSSLNRTITTRNCVNEKIRTITV